MTSQYINIRSEGSRGKQGDSPEEETLHTMNECSICLKRATLYEMDKEGWVRLPDKEDNPQWYCGICKHKEQHEVIQIRQGM